jgi:hypothetical protein
MGLEALMRAFPSGAEALAAAQAQERARAMCAADRDSLHLLLTEDILALEALQTPAGRRAAELLRTSRARRLARCYDCRLCRVPPPGP